VVLTVFLLFGLFSGGYILLSDVKVC